MAAALGTAWGAPPEPAGRLQPLNVSPTEVPAGESVTVGGSGCTPEGPVQLDLYNPSRLDPAVITAGSDGSFRQIVEVPSNSKGERARIRATCLTRDSRQRVMQTTVGVSNPKFLVTWVNVMFGLGASTFVMGLGLLVLRNPDRSGLRTKP
ncbi:MAG: hypothetical protein KY393_07880 [Actinobacteria bacterium]|nr:hypothetical protein [Actinomycetota bacterium]